MMCLDISPNSVGHHPVEDGRSCSPILEFKHHRLVVDHVSFFVIK